MEKKVYVELPPFTGRNVPITEIAVAMHKDAQYVRIGLQQGILKFGYAIKLENSNEYNYYCPDRKVWEEIGYFQPELTDSTNGSCRVTITQQGYYNTTAAKFNNYLRRNRI